MHLVDWETVCSPKDKRGLGIRGLVDMNVSLLTKWLWILGSTKGGLWKNLLIEKYWIQDV